MLDQEMTRDEAYQQILTIGLLSLRNRAWTMNGPEITEIETDHLHNIPSLIGESNWRRHEYYFNTERNSYIQRIKQIEAPAYSDTILRQYLAPWETLLIHLKADTPDQSEAHSQ